MEERRGRRRRTWWLGYFEKKRCGCEGEGSGLCPIYIGEKMIKNGEGEFLRSPPWPSLLLHDFFYLFFFGLGPPGLTGVPELTLTGSLLELGGVLLTDTVTAKHEEAKTFVRTAPKQVCNLQCAPRSLNFSRKCMCDINQKIFFIYLRGVNKFVFLLKQDFLKKNK